MKILDTTTINHIFKNNIRLQGRYFITPCVGDEMVTAEIVWNRKAPSNIKDIFQEDSFDKAMYLRHYFDMLNKHGDRSFFNMSGFGDISIIALAKTLLETEKSVIQNTLPFKEYKEEIIIYTSDGGLKKRITDEVGTGVKILVSNTL
ncbi:MAG TPA: hypothetical protein VFE57_05775 [Cyclobacteriaceae bacterium]|jgi:rRNA-processing protein FCF1|nr:hypothetical protein [Cyclobacteriaceae bacterium]